MVKFWVVLELNRFKPSGLLTIEVLTITGYENGQVVWKFWSSRFS